MIPEIDIWRAANLMVKRYGDKALEESRTRVDVHTAAGDHDSADSWRRISTAVVQLANNSRPDQCTDQNTPEKVGRAAAAFILDNRFYRENSAVKQGGRAGEGRDLCRGRA